MAAGIQIRIDVRDLEKAGARVQELLRRSRDTRPMMDEIGAALVSSTLHRFETGRAPDGTTWLKSKRAHREGGQTLVDRGHLRDSISHTADAGSVAVGSNLLYARIHQLGGVIKPKHAKYLAFTIGSQAVFAKQVEMPARPFLGLDGDDEAEIGAIVQDYLGGTLEGGAR